MLRTGCVVKRFPRRSGEDRRELVCPSMIRSLGKPKSLRNVELETGVSKSSVQRILKNLVHNLLEDDPNRVVEFRSRIILSFLTLILTGTILLL